MNVKPVEVEITGSTYSHFTYNNGLFSEELSPRTISNIPTSLIWYTCVYVLPSSDVVELVGVTVTVPFETTGTATVLPFSKTTRVNTAGLVIAIDNWPLLLSLKPLEVVIVWPAKFVNE